MSSIKFYFFILMFIQATCFAGDLNVWCFKNEDMGDWVAQSDTFMEENMTEVSYVMNNHLFQILVSRNDLFGPHQYDVVRHNLGDGTRIEYSLKSKVYDEWVRIDDQVSCAVSD